MACFICKRNDDNALDHGKWEIIEHVAVHQFCLVFSALPPPHQEINKGFFGYALSDILFYEEYIRGNHCTFCKKGNASVHCKHPGCKEYFHLSCGMQYGCQFKFNYARQSYCYLHHDIDDSEFNLHRKFDECFICFEMIGEYDPITSIPSCCNRGWFHRKCMKKAAVISPYLIHCPMCGENKESYSKFIADRGVFVPVKEAYVRNPEKEAILGSKVCCTTCDSSKKQKETS